MLVSDLQLFLGSFNTIYFLVVDVSKSLEDIRSSVLRWTKYIHSVASVESLSSQHSIVLIGNKVDLINSAKEKEVIAELKQYIGQIISCYCLISARETKRLDQLREIIKKETKNILQQHNPFFKVPKMYKQVAKRIKNEKSKLLLSTTTFRGVNDTCFAFLQDMGIILFNRMTKMICLDPQVIAKALACFVMPSEHEKIVFRTLPQSIRDLSIISQVPLH